jgi:hypothetical protein
MKRIGASFSVCLDGDGNKGLSTIIWFPKNLSLTRLGYCYLWFPFGVRAMIEFAKALFASFSFYAIVGGMIFLCATNI